MADDFTQLQVSITASLKDFSAKMGEFENILKGVEEQGKKTGESFGTMFASMFTAQEAIESLKKAFEFAKEAVADYDNEAMALFRLSKQIGEEGTEALKKYADSISKVTRFSKDDILSASNRLAINKLNREEIQKLIPVILDYATKSGRSATETAMAFGRAIEYGSTRSLRPFGIEINKTGSQLDIFNELLKVGEGNAKGMAEAAGNIGTGPLTEINNQIEVMKTSLGKDLLPAFKEFARMLKDDVMPRLSDLSTWFIKDGHEIFINLKIFIDAFRFAAGESPIKLWAETWISDARDFLSKTEDLNKIAKTRESAEERLKNIKDPSMWAKLGLPIDPVERKKVIDTVSEEYRDLLRDIDHKKIEVEAENKKSSRETRRKEIYDISPVNTGKTTPEKSNLSTETKGEIKAESAEAKKRQEIIDKIKSGSFVPEEEIYKAFAGFAALNSLVRYNYENFTYTKGEKGEAKAEGVMTEAEKEQASVKEKTELMSELGTESAAVRLKTSQDKQIKLMQNTMTALKKLRENDQLDQIRVEKDIANQQIAIDTQLANDKIALDKEVAKERMENNKMSADAFVSITGDMYKLSGEKMKAFFYLQQAASIASVWMNTAEAASKVEAQTGLLGIPLEALVWAKGLAETAVILAQTFPSLADGGAIYGAPHSAGGVIINAEGGEYIQSKRAVSMYGTHAMDAINRGIIPPSVLSSYTSISTVAAPSHAQAGGFVNAGKGSSNQATIVNFFDMTAFKQFLSSEDGKRAMINHVSENSFKYKKILAVT